MTEITILEKLEDQLLALKLKASQNGYTELAILIHKMREKARDFKFQETAE
jgi:hypothetical protein